MELMLLRIYQRQVEMHCQFALAAARGIRRSFNDNNPDLWFWVEAFLNATANLSKSFWPNKDRPNAIDREELRKSLEVDDSSPIQIRKMRNHFEHFDERVEQWWAEDAN